MLIKAYNDQETDSLAVEKIFNNVIIKYINENKVAGPNDNS
jgi:hypothetical protein